MKQSTMGKSFFIAVVVDENKNNIPLKTILHVNLESIKSDILAIRRKHL